MAKYIEENPIMVFSNEFEGKKYYTIGISKKDVDGEWQNAYMNCRFKKDVEIQNKTKILIKDAWLSFYKNSDNKVNWYVFINDFDIAGDIPSPEVEEVDLNDILGDSNTEISDEDFPFD